NPTNTVFDAKRLIGRKMDDLELKRDIKHFPFQHSITRATHSTEEISAMILTKMKETTEEISVMILTKMKETAEAYLSEKVTHAV
ncbi:heat shock protein 70 family, partial [Suillus subalutaceus]|uniref:heat shock protein 70 family n=1 Tax=Suillus subalutaceus TaxID=48586 RepID=UPI001B86CA66